MSWKLVREVSGRWTTEASSEQEDRKTIFYDYRKALNECRERNRRVKPNQTFEDLFGPGDEVKGLD